MSGLLGIHPRIRANKLAGIQIQSSAAGIVIPIVYGQARVPGNMLWYSDFDAIAHTSQQSVGGKGGGGQVANTTYTYQAAIIMGIAEGPIAAIVSGWAGSKKYSWSDMMALGYSLFVGSSGQSPWSYVTSKHPTEALGYDLTACVVNSTWPLGDNASLANHAWEVNGLYQVGGGILDANAADIVTDVLTSALHGIGFPLAQLGSMTLYRQYCAAAGLFLSPVVIQQQPTAAHLTEWAAATNTGLVWSGGVLKLVPYGDVPLTANGQTYTPNTTPIYDLNDDDFLATNGANPVEVTRKAASDCYNLVQVAFDNRAKDYNSDIAEAKDQASIERSGLRALPVVQLPSIKDPQIARTVAQLILQRQQSVRNTYKFRLGWKYILLEPMDLVTLTDAGLGMSLTPVRIIEVQESATGELDFVAEDWPFGTASATAYPQQSSSGYLPNTAVVPGSTAAPVIFEGPYPVADKPRELWIAAAGVSPATWGGCDVWLSTDGTSYQHIGQISGPARYGTLSGALATGPAAPSNDTTNTVSVDLTVSAGVMSSGSASDLATAVTLCAIGAGTSVEFLAYQTATLVATSKYNLTTLQRGLYNSTIPASHAIGQSFVRCDQAIFRFPFPQASIGQLLHFKFTSFNQYGNAPESLAAVTAYTYVVGLGLQSGAQPSLQLVPSLTNNQVDDTTYPVTVTATATNLPAVYVWALSRGFSRGQYTGIFASGSNSTNPLSGAGYSLNVNPNYKNSYWYRLTITVGANAYVAECQVQGLLAFIDPSTGNASTGASDSGSRAVNRFYGKGLPGDPDNTDAFGGHDGLTYGITSFAQRTGGGRGYTALDSGSVLLGGYMDFARGYTNKNSAYLPRNGSDATAVATIVGSLDNSGNAASSMLDSGARAINRFYAKGLSGNPDSLISVNDDTSYSRAYTSRINAGRPVVDFAEAIHSNKHLGYIGDGAGRYAAAEAGANVTETRTSSNTANVGGISAGLTQQGATRANTAIDASNQITSTTNLKQVTVGGPYGTYMQLSPGTGTPIDPVSASGGTLYVAAHDRHHGGATSYAAGSVAASTYGYPELVFSIDSSFSGVSTYHETTDWRSMLDTLNNYYIGVKTCVAGGTGTQPPAQPACPDPDTLIEYANGLTGTCGGLQPGDRIATFDIVTQERAECEVTHVECVTVRERTSIELEDGRILIGSTTHPLYLAVSGFVNLANVATGDLVIGVNSARVARIECLGPGEVMRISVTGKHTYLTNGLLSHNKVPAV